MHLIVDNTLDFSWVWKLIEFECGYQIWNKEQCHRRGITELGVRVLNPVTEYRVSCSGRESFTMRSSIPLKSEPLVLSNGSQLNTQIPLSVPTRSQYLAYIDHLCAS